VYFRVHIYGVKKHSCPPNVLNSLPKSWMATKLNKTSMEILLTRSHADWSARTKRFDSCSSSHQWSFIGAILHNRNKIMNEEEANGSFIQWGLQGSCWKWNNLKKGGSTLNWSWLESLSLIAMFWLRVAKIICEHLTKPLADLGRWGASVYNNWTTMRYDYVCLGR